MAAGLGMACGDGGESEGPVDTTELPSAESFYPQKPGNSWTYLVTPLVDIDVPTFKVVKIDEAGPVGGDGGSAQRPAYRHTTCKESPSPEACKQPPGADNKTDQTVGWLGTYNKVIANYREQAFKKFTTMMTEEDWWEPYRTKIDQRPDHLMAGAMWTETFREYKRPWNGPMTVSKQTETWRVEAVGETIVVNPPGGAPRTYPNCIKISHNTATGATTKTFWYARGIGKVKEMGTQMEELIDYTVVP